MFRPILLILLGLIWLTACTVSEVGKVVEVTPRSIPTSSPTPTDTATNVPTSTLISVTSPDRATPSQPVQTPIPTVILTLEPTAVPTATSVPSLTIRQPSIEELEEYLSGLSLMEDPYGHVIETIYEDVNGDGETDLVVSDYLFLGIFLWQGDKYEGTFIYQGYPWKYDPGSRITLEDWTNDGIPEVIFDFRDDTGGSGVIDTHWTRYVIHCPHDDFDCKVVWAGKTASFYEGNGRGGVSRLQADVEHLINSNDLPTLEVVTESFAIHSIGAVPYTSPIGDGILSYSGGRKVEDFPPFYPLESLKIYTSTLDIFTWNGTEFAWQETQVVSPATYIDSLAVLEATSSEGKIASITTRSNDDAGHLNDICQLFIDGNVLGLEFGCKENFTAVTWQDVTSDGQEELVVVTYSGTYTDTGFAGEVEYPGKDCVHQRAIIYQQAGPQMQEIADVTGCVVRSDLYGVRFEDIDADGQVEILAASGQIIGSRCFSAISTGPTQESCWWEVGYQNEVYKWNGLEFAYWELLPE